MMLGLVFAGLLLSSPTASLDELALRLDELAVRDARVVIEATGTARPVVILFADRHCYSCLRMVEVFVALRERPPRGIAFFLVDPQRADPATALVLSRYGVWAVPMTVLVDRSGRVARKLYGYQGPSTLAEEVDRLAER
jgi:hypothetical protein